VQYWDLMSHILVVKSLLAVASKLDVLSKHMNWMGAECMAFHVRVHFELDLELGLVLNSFQLSHCFSKRLRWAVIKCLSSGESWM
jgi:hypothetical protein